MDFLDCIISTVFGYYGAIGFLALHKYEYLWPMQQMDIYLKAKKFYDNEKYFCYFADKEYLSKKRAK